MCARACERDREDVCVRVLVREIERMCVCVCVCALAREIEREGVRCLMTVITLLR